MATFPALGPVTRSYTPGEYANSHISVLDGDELSVRHTNAATGYTLRLGFRGLTPAEHYTIVSHYSLHGRFAPFDLPAITLQDSGLTFPSGYEWIYASSPQTNYSPGLIEVTVELELVPPYTI